ncbi:phage tail spike protein [Limosilactobacillus reuteri]|uniref:Peptidase n=1 Tax=Limosilactobacillus reuteri TaxID=1598 RepID=A0AAX2SR12_LIMRT|nr:phage tail spike protein [Limosilactobacillus reuteri]RMX27467.1 peptidase [Limosilactobacillus reuteri]TGB09855.1 peptidase [Limosilactobacillus reuteri]
MRMYLLDKKQRVRRWLKDNDFIEAEMTEEINAANQINFSMPLKDCIADNIYYVAIPTPHSKQKYLLFKLLSERVQNDRIEYQGIEEAYDELKQYGYIKDIRPNDRTAEEMLKMVLESTRWTLGNVPETNHQSTNFYYISYLEALQKIVGLFNIELTFEVTIDSKSNKITRRQVNVYTEQGQRTGKRFEYGSNLLTVQQEQDSQELITALVGRGKGELVSEGHDDTPDGYGRRITFADVVWTKKDGHPVDKPAGQEYLVDPEATALYGFSDGNPRIGLTVFEDIEDPVELINATWRALQSLKRPKVSFKADVTDVGQLGLGDTVAIIRHDLKIEYFTRVYKVKHNLLNENDNQIELGDDFSSHSITSSLIKVDEIANEARETAGHAAIAANGKNNNYYSSVQPLAPVEGDIWYKDLGNSETDMYQYHNGGWVFIQSTRDLHVVENQVKEAQQGLNQAKADIINNKQKADADIENLNKSIETNKKVADESLQKLNDSVTNLQGQYDNNVIPNLNKVMADASDALQKYISAQNSIADLTKQAQQQGKDIADVSNTVKGLNINYANLAGDVNSTKVDVKGLQTTVGTANGDIAQLKLDAQNLQTMLAGKVDNTTYTNFVNLTNQALNARLTASDLNGYAKTVDVQATANGLRFDLNSVTDRMNNLKVGGRNLVAGTEQEYTMGFGIPNTTWKDGFAYGILPTTGSGNEILPQDPHMFWYTLTAGQEYTQTIWFRTDATAKDLKASGITWFTSDGHDYQPATIQRIGQNSYKMFSSYKWPGKQHNDVRLFDISELRQAFDLNTGTYLKFGKLKLETGNVSTDWTPAVEDTAHDLEQLSARITTTSQQFSSYYTKSETNNKTNSAKNDAINTIRNDGNWQGLSNILTNSGFLQTADGFLQKVQQTTIPMFSGGGVNLVKDTSESEISGKAYDIKDYYFSEPLEPNTKYTISIDAKVDQEALNHQQFIFVDPYTANWSWGAQMSCISASLEYQHYRYTFITPDASQKVTNISVYLAHPDGATNGDRDNLSGTGYFKKLKVERGEIDTPYSHAPSDNVSQIAFSELSQSLDGLRSTVGSNYGSLQSQLSQTATAIRGELTNNVAGLQNQIAANASGITALIQGNPVSLIRKGSFEDGSKGMWDNSATVVDVNNNNVPFTKALCISKRDSYEGERINVTPGDHYLVKAWIKSDEAKNNRVSIGLFLIKKDGKVDWINGATAVNHDWELVTSEITIPNNVVAAEGWIQIDAAQNFGHAYLADISITKISDKTMQVAATLDGLQSTVSNNYGALQSQINQTATTLREAVTDKVNNLQGQITTQADNINLTIGSTGDLSNICRNPDFMDGSTNGWENVSSSTGNGSSPSKYYGGINHRDGYYGKWFPVAAGDKYYFSTYAWQDQSSNSFNLGFVYEKKDGTWNWQSAVSFSPNEGFKTKYGSITIPNTVVKARIWVQIEATANFGNWWFTNVNVRKNDTLAQINMSAGTTLIQNDKIYMDSSSTIFSGKAFIPDAAITNISADKITAGTLDAGRINVVNLNANNITTGTINGQNLKIDLNTGNVEFQHGRIHNFSNTVDINLDQNYISTANYTTRALLKDGELQLTQPNLFDTNGNWYFRLFNGGGAGDAWAGASLIGRDSVIVANEANAQGATGFTSSPMGTATFSGLFTGKGTNNWMPTILGGAERGVFIKGGNQMSIKQNVMDPNDGGVFVTGSPFISVGVDGPNNNWWGNRIVIDGEYLHVPTAWRHTTGGAPNLVVASDGALVRSTSASKYKTEIHRDYSTNFGDRLLELPTATWIDKGQKERYQEGKRHIKPNKYFGMIAEDLADAGLDLFVSRNPQTHEIEGIQYERIAPALIPVIRKLKKKVQELEEKLNEQ